MTKANGITRNHRGTAAMIVAVLVAISLALLFPTDALAQGPGEGQAGPFVVVEETVAGQYHLKVWQSPERLVVSSVQVIIELTDAETGEVISNAVIRVFGTPSEAGERQVSLALNSPATPRYYQANIVLDHPGLWAFDIDVNGPFGEQRVTYAAQVHERTRAGSSLLLGTLMFALVTMAFAGGITYLVWSGRRQRRRMIAPGR